MALNPKKKHKIDLKSIFNPEGGTQKFRVTAQNKTIYISFQMIQKKFPPTSTRKVTRLLVRAYNVQETNYIAIVWPILVGGPGLLISLKYACMQKISHIGPHLASFGPFGPFGQVLPCKALFGLVLPHLTPFGPI